MLAQVGAACQSVYNYLRQLRPVVQALSVEARKTAVHAFVSLRLDYCNSLSFGVTDSLVQRLQAVQNARQWHSSIRAHHASIETTSLATSTATYRI